MPDVVLVTGVSRLLGGLTATALAAREDVGQVVGIDVVPPARPLPGVDFVRADLRNPVVARLVERYAVDTVVHMGVIATPTAAGGRASQKEINVLGTMQLLAACQKAPSVRRLVVKSAAAVYGASPHDPAVFAETAALGVRTANGFGRDSCEVETYVAAFSRRRPEVEVGVLRFANVIGPSIATGLTDHFSLPFVPIPAGFDGRLQFVHEDDCVRAMVLGATGSAERVVGTTNVAGDGVLTVSQCAGIVRRPVVPTLLAAEGSLRRAFRWSRMAELPEGQLQQLAYGRVVDTRLMRERLAFEPTWTTRQAFESFARSATLTVPGVDLARTGLHQVDTVLAAVGLRPDPATTPGARP
ncbi:NAD-dependent epimerase/dehydratase family protein [Arsenicicoccus dermatophilus]|uniref:NAD-dependent epimerase/dehydratase family protein n=1 Tax=Arsenicicoccus dermatophilus TaxID=1076331 RepID=UPI001F4D17F2|nr:NAD-dependent epimerase/dehydratase family protein [Arsenicicoccus dermatophilus]